MYNVCGVSLKCIHEQLFMILIEFDRICKKYNIKYTLEGGTLLGAVKYQDFVPWDDDLDVVMLRPEYERFLAVSSKELSPIFFLQNSVTDREFPLNYSKLRLKGSKYVQKNYDLLDINQGIFLDIVPYDYTDKQTYMIKRKIVGLLNGIKQVKLGMVLSQKYPCRPISLVKKLLYKMGSVLPLRTVNTMIQKTMVSANKSEWVYNFCNPLYEDKPMPESRFSEYKEVTFHGKNFLAVRDYESWLCEVFGDYMNEEPDCNTRGPSHAIVECSLHEQKAKKIGVLTFHRADNYGAVLQTYALTHYITYFIRENDLDASCEVIDYRNDAIEKRYNIRKLCEILRIKTKIKHLLLDSHLKRNRKNFQIFRKIYLSVSNASYDRSTIYKSNEEYDIFITGSDQVWNGMLTNQDLSYFLDFCTEDKIRIAYAASVGFEKIFFDHYDEFEHLLEKFTFISAREDLLCDGLKARGLTDTVKVLDPVFLLTADQYKCIESVKNLVDGAYILVYVIAFEKNIYRFAQKLSKKTGYKIVYINVDKTYKKGVVNLRDVPTQHFLSLIKNAKYVVTSSFHGLAFSAIYNTCVYYQLSNSENNFNSRIITLVNALGLEQQNVDTVDVESAPNIDWEYVNSKIQKLRKESKMYVKSVFIESRIME